MNPQPLNRMLNEELPRPDPAVVALEDQLFFRSRFVAIFGEINQTMAASTCRKLLALNEQSGDPITVLISSPGGHVESGDAIHDMIRFIDAPVTTLGSGWVASAAAHIFLSVPKDRRLCLPNTRFMIHQPSGGTGGNASDIAIQAKEILRTRERISRVIAEQTGQPLERVQIDIERDYWMSPEEAIAYGLVSRIVAHRKDIHPG